MPDLSLREKIEAYQPTWFRAVPYIPLCIIREFIDAHERDLVARIEEMKQYSVNAEHGSGYLAAIHDVLALIKPVVKESLTTDVNNSGNSGRESIAIQTRDERPARNHIKANFDDAHDMTIRELYRATDALYEAIDAAADRTARDKTSEIVAAIEQGFEKIAGVIGDQLFMMRTQ